MTTITALPAAPNPLTDSQSAFNSKALAFTQALVSLPDEINAVAAEMVSLLGGNVLLTDVVFLTAADSPVSISDSSRGKLYAIDCTSGPVTVNLAQITALTLATPWSVGFKKLDSSSNAIMVNRGGTDTIDGAASIVIATPGAGAELLPDIDPMPDRWTARRFGTGTERLQGKETIWIPAGAMIPRTTDGAAGGTAETTTNKVMLKTLDFDQSTVEYAQFSVRMPKSWNEGTLTARFLWSSSVSGTNAVVWGLQAVAISDDDALDAAFGTAQTVTDAQTAQSDLMQTAETAALTVGGTPAAEDWVVFQAYRDAASGSDTLAGDARLHGIALFYTTDAATDA